MPLLHRLPSALALAAILAWSKGTRAHRWLGRLAAQALVLSAMASFGIQPRRHLSWRRIRLVVTLVSIPLAIWAVRRGRIAAHQRAMPANAGGPFTAGRFAIFAPGRDPYGALLG